ncbi:hypothetical protein A2G96_19945 [Cupriavidus nantongensis]|uniref:Uncharacterized protein n=1 Tax=Cupriavidus nantongensis TaxID=1796606 RepID=A0A142JP38_9BURK|nr:hypothetical protein A2G96_19945 [Cupriavidus nantongensis]
MVPPELARHFKSSSSHVLKRQSAHAGQSLPLYSIYRVGVDACQIFEMFSLQRPRRWGRRSERDMYPSSLDMVYWSQPSTGLMNLSMQMAMRTRGLR